MGVDLQEQLIVQQFGTGICERKQGESLHDGTFFGVAATALDVIRISDGSRRDLALLQRILTIGSLR